MFGIDWAHAHLFWRAYQCLCYESESQIHLDCSWEAYDCKQSCKTHFVVRILYVEALIVGALVVYQRPRRFFLATTANDLGRYELSGQN